MKLKLPKLGRGKRGTPESRKRLRRMRAKRFGREVSRRFLESQGLSGDVFSKSSFIHAKLGIFDQAMGSGSNNISNDSTINLPVLDTPQKVNNESSPDISSIIKQLGALMKVADKLGVLSKQQQDVLTKQIAQAKRIAKEQQLEAKPAAIPEPVTGVGESGDIKPVADAAEKLIDAFNELYGVVKDKLEEQEDENDNKEQGLIRRLQERFGLDEYADIRNKRKAAQAARIRTNPGYKIEYSGGRMKFKNVQTKRYASAAEAVATKKPSMLGRAASRVRGAVGTSMANAKRIGGGTLAAVSGFGKSVLGGAARRAAGSKVVKGGSSAIAGLLGKSLRTAKAGQGVAAKVGPAAIKKIAGPIIAKGLGRTALKSIPIAGAIAGGGMAIMKLIQGDPIGAGLEATSGLAGPLTAIPAFIAATARDTYAGAFGVQPEQDPLFSTRMTLVTGIITSLVKNALSEKIEKPDTAKPSGGMPSIMAAPTQPPPAAQPSAKPTVSAITPPSAPTPSGGAAGGGESVGSSGAAAPTASSGGESTVQAASGGVTPTVQQQTPITVTAPTATPEPSLTSTGAKIADASVTNADMAAAGGSTQTMFPGTAVPMPAVTPTSKTGARGMGDVPEVNYGDIGDIASQLYFRSAV